MVKFARLVKAGRFQCESARTATRKSHKLISQTTDIYFLGALDWRLDVLDLFVGESDFFGGFSLLIDEHLLPVSSHGLLSFSVGVFKCPLLIRTWIILD